MIATKNYQSEAVIRGMAARAFPDRELAEIRELTEGMCNVTYRLTFADGGTAILKVGPEHARNALRNENNMMQVEIRSLQLLENHPEVMTPALYDGDVSKTLCSGAYFLMETMPGKNFIGLQKTMSKAEKAVIHREIGQKVRQIGEITGECFGILGEEPFDSFHAFFTCLMENLLADTEKAKVDYGTPHKEILAMLERDKPFFDEVTTPRLCHWDLWDGNVFVEDGHVSGIIDWERSYLAEPLMCDQFRRHGCKQAFLEGYGQTEFTPAEKRRMAWYDLFLFGTMITEEVFREYEPGSQSGWVRPFFDAAMKELKA